MLRRSSRFKAEVYPTIILAESENGSILEQKWRQWVEAESFKRYVAEPKCNNIKILIGSRLVYHMFIHDVQASVLLSINPLISYVELDLPLPSCRKLWDAKSATDWKMFYLEKITKAPSHYHLSHNLYRTSRSLTSSASRSTSRWQNTFPYTACSLS